MNRLRSDSNIGSDVQGVASSLNIVNEILFLMKLNLIVFKLVFLKAVWLLVVLETSFEELLEIVEFLLVHFKFLE